MMRRYIRLFKKWMWLIVLAAGIAGAVSFVVSNEGPQLYEARTTLLIGGTLDSPNPRSADISLGVDLAQIYSLLVTTTDILQGVIDELELDASLNQLRNMISVKILGTAPFIELTAVNEDPDLAIDVANSLANQLILKSPTNLTPDQQNQIDFSQSQIELLTDQVSALLEQLKAIDEKLAAATAQDEVLVLTGQRNSVMDQINQAQATVAQYSSDIISLRERTNSLTVVESATRASTVNGPSRVMMTVIGLVVGGAIAVGAILLIDNLNDSLRSSEEIARWMGLPVLGTIARIGKRRDGNGQRLITKQSPQSLVAEGYRTIQTNLLFAAGEKPKGVYLVTSPGAQEGKSITTTNLALTLALADVKVLLIDADLRQPKIHELFGLKNDAGLSSLVLTPPELDLTKVNDSDIPNVLKNCLHSTDIPNLTIITSGSLPEGRTRVFDFVYLREWIEVFKTVLHVDVILFDTPPCLAVADTSILAATTKADVILVIQAGRTRREVAQRAKGQFIHIGSTIKGVVLNGVNPSEVDHGYGYGYYDEIPPMPTRGAQPSNWPMPTGKAPGVNP